jgi:hypothetical protein
VSGLRQGHKGYLRVQSGERNAADAVMWNAAQSSSPPESKTLPLFVDLALETIGGPPDLDEWRASAVRLTPTVAARRRRGCLSDPATFAAVRERIAEVLASPAAKTAAAISLGSGLSPTYGGLPYDFCTAAPCTSAFRAYLRERYGDVESLRRSWSVELASWDDVRPMSLRECGFPTAPRYTAWLDHAVFREKVFGEFVRGAVLECRRLAPGIPVGFFGGVPGSVYGAADIDAILGEVGWLGRGPLGVKEPLDEIITSRMRPGTRLAGKPATNVAAAGAVALGGESIQVFGDDPGLAPRGAPLRGFGRLLELSVPASQESRGDRGARRAAVALVYSPSSVKASFIEDARANDFPWERMAREDLKPLAQEDSSWQRVWCAWCRLLQDMGVPYAVITSDQVARGDLASRGYRAAVLVRALSVSGDEADALRSFVRAGGTVIADAGAGIYDGTLSVAGEGVLADLFGVKRKGTRFSEAGAKRVTVATRQLSHKDKPGTRSWFTRTGPLGIGPAETGMTLAGADAEGAFGEFPCLIVNEFGGGWAVTLNLALSGYLELREQAQAGEALRKLVQGAMRRSGVQPTIDVAIDEDVVPRPIVELRLLGDAFLATVTRPGVKGGASARCRFRLVQGGVRALYDSLSGVFLGWTDTIDVEIAPSESRAFALLPYRVVGIRAQTLGRPAEAARDGPERVEVTLLREGDADLCFHVVELEVIGPDGGEHPELGRLVEISGGRAETVIPFGEGDARGRWTLRLRDAATGTVSVARLIR